MKPKKAQKKIKKYYCTMCGAEEIEVSGEAKDFVGTTGKRKIITGWRCPNAYNCHNQDYCRVFEHDDPPWYSFINRKCNTCGLSTLDSFGALL